ncbi:MAG: DUF4129 domain-containing protein [Chitinophagaceae bacterium]|nr:DUF4129 domain-containing protein [Chitinophagaceae bacterium]
MIMLLHRHSFNAIFVILLLVSLPALGQAQFPGDEDSTALVDTSVTEDTLIDDDEYDDEPTETTTIWFSRKDLLSNGGGPDSISLRGIPDSSLTRLKKDDDFWYVDYPFDKSKKKKANDLKSKTPLTRTPVFQTILWLVIIGGFAAFVIIYLANSNVGLFRKRNSHIASPDEMEVETENIFEINYQREIDKAVSKANYRLAVRLMFLRLLKELSEKKLIQYKPDRTNFDYLMQLSTTKHYNEFFRLTRHYEYTWYGQFDIDPEKYILLRKDFENFGKHA